MLDRLVSMSILSHSGDKHFRDFVDAHSIIGKIIQGRSGEDGIHLCIEGISSTHEIDQSLWVLKHRPGIMPGIAFVRCITPFKWIEWRLERSVFESSSH